MTFTINSYRSYGPERDAKLEKFSSKISKLESKDELTGKQSAKLDRLYRKLDKYTPSDELIVRNTDEGLGFTIVDTVYDDIIDGSETLRFVVKGESENRSRTSTVLWLNHPEKTNDKYTIDSNVTVSVDGIPHNSEYDREWVEVYANDNLVFSKYI